MKQETEIEVLVAGPEHEVYVDTILNTIAEAAKVRGTGIAKRTHEYLAKKMMEAKAVIALTKDGRFAGFSYIETWENQQYVTTSGLIVAYCQAYQGHDLYASPYPLAACQNLFTDQRRSGHGDEYGIRLSACNVCRPDRRRGILERLRGLCQRRRAASYRS